MNVVLRFVAFVLGLWPESLVRFAAKALGTLWHLAIPYRRRVVRENLQRAFPDLDEHARARLARGAHVHLVWTLLEFLRIRHYDRAALERRVELEGIEHLEAARAEGRGVLCLGAHLGSFELCVAAAAERFGPVSLVVKPFSGGVDTFVNDTRRGAGLQVIPAAGAVKPVLKALRRNEIVVFVLDQNATRSIGVFVDFFGALACTMTALAVFAQRTGAPVVAAEPYRRPNGEHVLAVSPAIPFERQPTRDDTIRHMTQRYTEWIQGAIERHPEQWFWTHKRWRTRPR